MMKKTHPARRVPRKIGSDDDNDDDVVSSDTGASKPSKSSNLATKQPALTQSRSSGHAWLTSDSVSAIRRAAVKPRESTLLRSTFSGAEEDGDNNEDDQANLNAPKRSGLSRLAMQRKALKPRSSQLALDAAASRRVDSDEDRPSYSAAALRELKDSTPSTPRDFLSTDIERVASGTKELDLSSKFGSSLSRYQRPSIIPSAAEIAEKKARRARLAKEQAAEEYISLDPDDPGLDDDGEELDSNVERDERGRLVLKAKPDKYNQAETRLVRDDEDLMEGFEEFTEADSKMALGRKAEAEAARRRKLDIAAQIAAAEGGVDSDDDAASDDSERERNAIFEASQTRHGMYASAHQRDADSRDTADRPRTPPRIAPLPTLEGALTRLRGRMTEMQSDRARQLAEMEALRREKIRLAEEEVRIQRALRETAEKFAALRAEAASRTTDGDAVKGGERRHEQTLQGAGVVLNETAAISNDDAMLSS